MRSKRPFTTPAILLISLVLPGAARAGEPLCDWLGAIGEAAAQAADGHGTARLAAAERALAARPAGPAAALTGIAAAAALAALGRGPEAAPLLEAARPEAPERLRGWLDLARGEALLRAGHAGAAAELLAAASAGTGPAARRARWVVAEAFLDDGRPEAAAAALEPLLRRAPGDPEARRGRLHLAEAERRIGRTDRALHRWRELALEVPDRAEGIEALAALDRLAATPDAPAGARLDGLDRLLRAERLLARGRAAEAWAEADAAAAAAPPAPGPRLQLLRAFIRTGEGRLSDAEALARPLAAPGVPAGVRRGAELVLARAAGRAGRTAEAARHFLAVADGQEPVPGLAEARERELSDEAAFLAAWIWIDGGDLPRAVERLEAFARAHPASHRTEAARWFAAWARVRQGDSAGARRALAALERTAHAEAARYWSARLEPDPVRAAALLARIDGRSDDGWYLALARVRLRARSAAPPEPPTPGPLEPLAVPEGPAGERLTAGATLLALAWPEAARGELEEALRQPRARPSAAPLAELAAFAGDAELAYWVARDQLGATRRSARWLHPSPRPAQLEAAAAAAGLDPDLLRAVVRRESAFRPDVRSAAGAEGLAQLLPATARRLGTLAGLPADEPLRLGDPDVSLGLGAHYLGLLADRLGDEAVVLAGYNAGPAPAAGWAQLRAGRPLDEWVESIPYRETRAYVKGVLSARETYRRLAGRPPALDPDRPIPAPRGGVLF